MPRTVAIVEDEAPIRENYADALRRQGCRVQTFANREHAMGAFRTRLPDLVLLDIALQDEIDAGFEMCRERRTLSSKLPIIFLTARDSDYDSIAGLRVGADDYLTKDVAIPHIIAQISALFRRVEALGDPTNQRNERKCGELTIDPDVVGAISRSSASDEIGDLTRSYSAMLVRLKDYNAYLESMASKLTHELRTPVTVVSSSLKNLDSTSLNPDQEKFLDRAREGIDR